MSLSPVLQIFILLISRTYLFSLLNVPLILPLCISQDSPEKQNQVGMVAGMEVMHGPSNMDFHSPVLVWLWPLLGAQSASCRYQHWAPYVTLGWSARYLVANWLHWWQIDTISIMQVSELCSYWNSHLVWIWTCLPPHTMILQKLPNVDLQNTLYTITVSHVALSLIKELNWQPMKWAMNICSRNSLVLPCSSSSWISWLDRMVERPFEDSVIAPAGWHYLTELQQCPLRCRIFSKSVSSIRRCFSHSQNVWVQELMDSIAELPLSFPVILGSAGLEVSVPKRGRLPPANTMTPLNQTLRLPPSHLGLCMPLY